MHHKKIFLILGIFVFLFSIYAMGCGCGMALAPPEVFNSMKESQAYLIVDVEGPNSYTQKPFFRFVSLDKEYDVKMVFPMKELPTNVEGEKLSIREFLQNEKINQVKDEEEKQSIEGVLNRAKEPMAVPAFLGGFGLSSIVIVFLTMMPTGIGSNEMATSRGALGALAHYEFEGGELDIYDVSSQKTLEALVEELEFTPDGELKELVDKYSDYYVAVMTLNVPTVLPKKEMDFLKSKCSSEFENAKQLLQTKPTIEWEELGINPRDVMRGSYESSCEARIVSLVTNATNPSSDVKGVMISMSFNSDEIFYPISIVNSYTYPVTEQAYYVRTPVGMQFTPESTIDNKILLDNKRWYIVRDTSMDLEGKIEPATAQTKSEDNWLMTLKTLYENAFLLSLVFLLLIFGLLVFFTLRLPTNEKPDWKNLTAIILFGAVIGAIYALVKGKKKFAAILFLAWFIILLTAIL